MATFVPCLNPSWSLSAATEVFSLIRILIDHGLVRHLRRRSGSGLIEKKMLKTPLLILYISRIEIKTANLIFLLYPLYRIFWWEFEFEFEDIIVKQMKFESTLDFGFRGFYDVCSSSDKNNFGIVLFLIIIASLKLLSQLYCFSLENLNRLT